MRSGKQRFLGEVNPVAARLRLTIVQATSLLLLLLLPLPAAAGNAEDFTYETNNGAITITGYTGPGGDVIIPDTVNGLPVTSIGSSAFLFNSSLTNIAIPNSVTNIGYAAFAYCTSLTTATIGNRVTVIEGYAFKSCSLLTNLTIPNSVTKIRTSAFSECSSLTSITLGNSVAVIEDYAFKSCSLLTNLTIPETVTFIFGQAFYSCSSLAGVYFKGNAPTTGYLVLDGATNAIVYYLPGKSGWIATFSDRPTALWQPKLQTSDASFGVQTNQFGFNIAWASGMVTVVEACTNLANLVWFPLQTNTLTSDTFYFSDSEWTNSSRRFYRVRWP